MGLDTPDGLGFVFSLFLYREAFPGTTMLWGLGVVCAPQCLAILARLETVDRDAKK
jgi:hypothetical protein